MYAIMNHCPNQNIEHPPPQKAPLLWLFAVHLIPLSLVPITSDVISVSVVLSFTECQIFEMLQHVLLCTLFCLAYFT